MWQDGKLGVIKEVLWHQAQFKAGEEMSSCEKMKLNQRTWMVQPFHLHHSQSCQSINYSIAKVIQPKTR